MKYDEYKDEVKQIIKEKFVLRCTNKKLRNPFSSMVYLSVNEEGINIEGYYRNISSVISYVDTDFYAVHDITIKDLVGFGVRFSILTGDAITQGTYDNGSRGRQPEWWTPGEFRWKLSLDSIKDVLMYISAHPTAKDSILKSIAIYKTLLLIRRSRLFGCYVLYQYWQKARS